MPAPGLQLNFGPVVRSIQETKKHPDSSILLPSILYEDSQNSPKLISLNATPARFLSTVRPSLCLGLDLDLDLDVTHLLAVKVLMASCGLGGQISITCGNWIWWIWGEMATEFEWSAGLGLRGNGRKLIRKLSDDSRLAHRWGAVW